eukprot:COSAG01_NODE_51052_length_358_cov_0.598456_1_plen_21_part_10
MGAGAAPSCGRDDADDDDDDE